MTVSLPAIRVAVPSEQHHRELISCQVACPVHTDARGYVRAIAEGRFEEAYLIARGPNPFASICGRVCAAPCEVACRRGKIPTTDADGCLVSRDQPIAIRALKRAACERFGPEALGAETSFAAVRAFVPEVSADAEELASLLRAARQPTIELGRGQRVAIIGAGPSGLSAAHDLALLGFSPVVFEVEPYPAGMLWVGVPAYRLPRELIRREVAVIQALGVEIRCNTRVGKDVSFDQLRRDYAAVILAVGAKRPRLLGLPGEPGPGVLGGVDFLRAAALGEPLSIGAEVVVIGGGNVAFDVARTVLRQTEYDISRTAARLTGTRKVTLVSLETLEEMPADTVEIVEGDEEGVVRKGGWGPVEIQRDASGKVKSLLVQRCLRVFDESRKFSPVFAPEQRESIPCDTVLIAAGQATDLSFLESGGTDVEQGRPGWPKVDPLTLATTAKGVFAAGDLAHGTRLIIDAVASGKRAARSVYQYLVGKPLSGDLLTRFVSLEGYRRELGYERIRRVELPTSDPHQRLQAASEIVELPLSDDAARREASRCLDCGVTPVFDGERCVLCGGCADVCPTLCLKLVALDTLEPSAELDRAVTAALGEGANPNGASAILKDEDRCIRCALCVHRCPVDAISMDRVTFQTHWRN